jgi:hypothetical protein
MADATPSTKRKNLMTNLKQELIDNGDANYNFSRQSDVEHIVGEMIISRSNSVEEVAERTTVMVQMLKPENARAVFQETVMYIGARTADVTEDDLSCLAIYDAYLSVVTPWLVQHGYPDLRPKH